MLHVALQVIWLFGFIAAAVIRARYTRQLREKRGTDDWKTGVEAPLMLLNFLGMQLIPIIYLLTPWLDFAEYGLPTSASVMAGLAGAALFAVAVWLLWRSHADLGRSWSPSLEIVEQHSLVTEGVFRYIRHPMYAAHLLWAIAQILILQNWIAGWCFLAAQIPLLVYRIPREEEMMLAHFGEEYRQYMDRSGRIVPPLRR